MHILQNPVKSIWFCAKNAIFREPLTFLLRIKMIGKINNPPSCPFCKITLAAFYAPEDDQAPSPGDALVCSHCGEFLEFDKGLGLIGISSETLVQISGPALQRAKRDVETLLSLRRLKNQMKKVQG
jgi:hypothetical protein